MYKINKNMLNKSLKVMGNVLDISPRVKGFRGYTSRFDDFNNIIGSGGFTCFTPQIDLASEVKSSLRHFMSPYLYIYGDLDSSISKAVAVNIIDYIKGQDIIDNKVSDVLKKEINDSVSRVTDGKFKKYVTSPKLSKLLVKAFGETSEVVTWFTNSKPTKALDDDYRVFISVLPHHIAGMAYYCSGNHGGQDWQEWKGSSCQDTLRAGAIKEIQHLPATLLDGTVAVAYLSYKENSNIFKPSYLARCLIRLSYIEGRPLFIACRVFGTSKNTKNLLMYALKQQIKDLYNADDVVTQGSTFYTHLKLNKKAKFTGVKVEHCSTCNGEGQVRHYNCEGYDCDDDYDMVDCDDCNGTGRVPTDEICVFYPYIDEKELIRHNGDSIEFRFDKDFVKKFVNKGELVNV